MKFKMYRYWFNGFILILINFGNSFTKSINNSYAKDTSWDILVFTQRWPQTSCIEWQEKNPNNTCQFPILKNTWTIHGLWPNKIGKKESPNFCNKTLHFNIAELQPISTDLSKFWTNVENNTKSDSFWKHEWMKHGTCAASLPELDSEFKYFSQGLKLFKEYNMTEILSKKNIVPSSNGYDMSNIYALLYDELGKEPIINCVVDKNTKISLLSEIELCFNKTFDMVDCSILKGDNYDKTQVLTDCSLNKPVFYPGQTAGASLQENDTEDDYNIRVRQLLRIYKMLQFLIWVTL